jgi:hypothetical protein
MARKRRERDAPRPTQSPTATPTPTSSSTRRRDPRPFIYYGLDQVFTIAYVYALVAVIPNRLGSASIHLWSIPVLLQAVALGTLAVVWPRARRAGWWVAVIAASALLLSTILLIVRLVASAAFLAGVYGAFGQAAAASALIGVALVIELVALLPIVQVRYLLSRAGRRTYL